MSVTGKLSGKASYFTLDAVRFEITKATPKHTRTLVSTVDTGSYDEATDMLHEEQIPVKLGTELEIEGFFYKSNTQSGIIAKLYTGISALPVILNLDPTTIYGHGNFDLSDFACNVPVDDKVDFTCSMKSNGKFVPGA